MKATQGKKNAKTSAPAQVAVIMGSDSDLDALKPGLDIMESFGVSFDVTVASAHRTPKHLENTVKKFEAAGGCIVIAAAGGAAHLPGVVAALTTLPVIGIPIKSSLLGLDSLLSIVQMPAGIPVATVGINASANAALLAIEILALKSSKLKSSLIAYRAAQADKVIAKSAKLKKTGFRNYSA